MSLSIFTNHPDGRKAIFLGDLVDRRPRIVDTLKTVMAMSQSGTALCVPGNHDIKLKRKLEGRDVAVTYGLDRTLAELERPFLIQVSRRIRPDPPLVGFEHLRRIAVRRMRLSHLRQSHFPERNPFLGHDCPRQGTGQGGAG